MARRVIEHNGNVEETIALARPYWTSGEHVVILWDDVETEYLDFIIATRLNDDEPLEELVRFYRRRKSMRKPYSTRLTNMVSYLASRLEVDPHRLRGRFRNLRLDMEGVDIEQ